MFPNQVSCKPGAGLIEGALAAQAESPPAGPQCRNTSLRCERCVFTFGPVQWPRAAGHDSSEAGRKSRASQRGGPPRGHAVRPPGTDGRLLSAVRPATQATGCSAPTNPLASGGRRDALRRRRCCGRGRSSSWRSSPPPSSPAPASHGCTDLPDAGHERLGPGVWSPTGV